MPTIELDAATIDYIDTGGTGPCLVLLHGVLMDATVWDQVIVHLGDDFRCVAPTLPLGAHRHPVPPGAVLDNEALTRIVADLMDRLELRDVTLVLNDWGGAQIITELGLDHRVGRLAFVACEAFENVPPGVPGRRLARLAATPGGLALQARLARHPAIRRQAAAWMAKHPIPDSMLARWFTAMRDPLIRRDLRRFCIGLPRRTARDWSTGLTGFDRPALVVWAPEDRMMPAAHGQRLAAVLPHSSLVEVKDSFTLIPLDQPKALADHLSRFVNTPTGHGGGQGARSENATAPAPSSSARSHTHGGRRDRASGRHR